MTDLVEIPQWEPGIYQWEESDPVLGGVEGIDNVPTRQLANRTAYLKAQQEAHEAAADPHPQYMTAAESDAVIAAAVAALVNSSPATLDTLAELAAALGNDPDFATTLTNLLALKAPLDSAALTGTPTSPTPALFDSGTRIATMEALKRGSGNFRQTYTLGANTTLDDSHIGAVVSVSSVGVTILLPAASSVQAGDAITFRCGISSLSGFIINADGTDVIGTGRGTNATTINPKAWDTFTLTSNGTNTWLISTGYVSDVAFSAIRAATGYQQLPSGVIVQWGTWTGSGTPGNPVAVTFPLAFPVACDIVIPGAINAATTNSAAWYDTPSTTGFNGRCAVASLACRYIAIGR